MTGNETPTHTFIFTRFGLGQACNDFYLQNLPLFKRFLFKSITNQTNKNFHWVLLIDKKIPLNAKNELQTLALKCKELRLHFHDPFSNFELLPDFNRIMRDFGVLDGHTVINVRIDADDALSDDYIQLIQEIFSREAKNYKSSCVNAVSGLYLYLTNEVIVEMEKTNYSVQSICYKFESKINKHIHSWSHQNLVKEHASDKQKNHVVVRRKKPLWLRTIRKDSTSRHGRTVGFFETRFLFIRQVRYTLKKYFFNDGHNKLVRKINTEDGLTHFGFTVNEMKEAKVSDINTALPKPPTEIKVKGNRSRLTIKTAILQEARQLSKKQIRMGKLNELKSLFYSF